MQNDDGEVQREDVMIQYGRLRGADPEVGGMRGKCEGHIWEVVDIVYRSHCCSLFFAKISVSYFLCELFLFLGYCLLW